VTVHVTVAIQRDGQSRTALVFATASDPSPEEQLAALERAATAVTDEAKRLREESPSDDEPE
jgi:hypothetical protein